MTIQVRGYDLELGDTVELPGKVFTVVEIRPLGMYYSAVLTTDSDLVTVRNAALYDVTRRGAAQ
jgi:hypothetical protein